MGRVLMSKCCALIWMMLFRHISFSPYWTHQEQQGRKTVWSRAAASPYSAEGLKIWLKLEDIRKVWFIYPWTGPFKQSSIVNRLKPTHQLLLRHHVKDSNTIFFF